MLPLRGTTKNTLFKPMRKGKFKLSLETPKFGGPFELTIDDGQKLTLKDVMIGEVWLCSGQSNMDMRMAGRIADPVENTLEASIVAPNQGFAPLISPLL